MAGEKHFEFLLYSLQWLAPVCAHMHIAAFNMNFLLISGSPGENEIHCSLGK